MEGEESQSQIHNKCQPNGNGVEDDDETIDVDYEFIINKLQKENAALRKIVISSLKSNLALFVKYCKAVDQESMEAVIDELITTDSTLIPLFEKEKLWDTLGNKGYGELSAHILRMIGKAQNYFDPSDWQCLAIFNDKENFQKLLDEGLSLEGGQDSSKDPLILDESASYNYGVLKFLIEQGCDVNAVDKYNGKTPLHKSVDDNSLACVRLLLDNGANIDSETKDGETPLHLAVLASSKIVRELCQRGANLEVVSKYGNTPLLDASRMGKEKCAKILMEYNANLNAIDKNGETPLMHFITKSNDIAKLMVEKGANVNIVSLAGKTAISLANNDEMRKFLIAHGAK